MVKLSELTGPSWVPVRETEVLVGNFTCVVCERSLCNLNSIQGIVDGDVLCVKRKSVQSSVCFRRRILDKTTGPSGVPVRVTSGLVGNIPELCVKEVCAILFFFVSGDASNEVSEP